MVFVRGIGRDGGFRRVAADLDLLRLADEFFLVLDETMQCKFEGYNLTYDSIVGLEVINHE